MSCAARGAGSCGGDECCQWRQGDTIYRERIWFTYHKAWRSARINSLLFDNPAAYNNPSRDPVPPATLYPAGDVNLAGEGEGGAGLRVDVRDIEAELTPWATLPVTRARVGALSAYALASGLHEADDRYYYSRVPEDGWSNPIVKGLFFSYLSCGARALFLFPSPQSPLP